MFNIPQKKICALVKFAVIIVLIRIKRISVIMTIQAILFILLVSAFYGCLFHVITGGNVFTIFINIAIAIAGFFAGQFVGSVIGREPLRLGVIYFGWGSMVSFLFLAIGYFISHPLF